MPPEAAPDFIPDDETPDTRLPSASAPDFIPDDENTPNSVSTQSVKPSETAPNGLGSAPFWNFNPQAKKPWLQAFKDKWNVNDPESKAMAETFARPGALTQAALLEALKRLTTGGQEGLGSENWHAAMKGNAKGLPQLLEEKFGMGPIKAHLLGLPASVVSDPLNGLFGSGNIGTSAAERAGVLGVGRGTDVAGQLNSQYAEALKNAFTKDALKNAITETVPGTGLVAKGYDKLGRPISGGLQALGKKAFVEPFRKVNAEITSKIRGASKNPTAFTDALWNEGNPILSGSNVDIGNQITEARKNSWTPIQEALEQSGQKLGKVDLAPDLRSNAQAAMAAELQDEARTQYLEKLEDAGQAYDETNPDDAMKFVTGSAKLLKKLQSKADPLEWLKGKIASGNPEQEKEGIELLAKSAPDLKDVINGNAKHLMNEGSRNEVIPFYHALINDLGRGPRSMEELQEMKAGLNNVAARNAAMQTNMFNRNSLQNAKKSASMQAADDVGNLIDKKIEEALGKAAVPAAARARYSAIRRGELPAWRTIQQAEARPWLSKLDQLGGASALYMHDPKMLLPFLAAKAGTELQRSPHFGVGLGNTLNRAAKSNIWDNALRRYLMEKAVQPQGGNQ